MMNRVKIPNKVATAIESAWEVNKNNINVVRHLYLNNWNLLKHETDKHIFLTLRDYAESKPITYMRALVEGYEVEEERYLVDIYLMDSCYIPGCEIYNANEPGNFITDRDSIDLLFQTTTGEKSEVMQFGIRSKYIHILITPDMVKKYVPVKIH